MEFNNTQCCNKKSTIEDTRLGLVGDKLASPLGPLCIYDYRSTEMRSHTLVRLTAVKEFQALCFVSPTHTEGLLHK